eukprot:COSAG01_NODE_21607_length_893_cov_67.313602_1_plen_64_part_10
MRLLPVYRPHNIRIQTTDPSELYQNGAQECGRVYVRVIARWNDASLFEHGLPGAEPRVHDASHL